MSRDVRRWLIAAAVTALGAAAAFSAGDGKSTRRAVYPSEFPAGPGKSIADRMCVTCHSASLTTQQAKDSTGWEKTLGQMEKWGGAPTPAEHDTLRTYLLAHFGARAKK